MSTSRSHKRSIETSRSDNSYAAYENRPLELLRSIEDYSRGVGTQFEDVLPRGFNGRERASTLGLDFLVFLERAVGDNIRCVTYILYDDL